MVTVGQRGPLPHRKRRDSGEQHFTEQAHRQKNTHIKLLQNKTIMLVSQVYSHAYSRYFAFFFFFSAKHRCIELSAPQRHLDLVGQCPMCPIVCHLCTPQIHKHTHTSAAHTHIHTHIHIHTQTQL